MNSPKDYLQEQLKMRGDTDHTERRKADAERERRQAEKKGRAIILRDVVIPYLAKQKAEFSRMVCLETEWATDSSTGLPTSVSFFLQECPGHSSHQRKVSSTFTIDVMPGVLVGQVISGKQTADVKNVSEQVGISEPTDLIPNKLAKLLKLAIDDYVNAPRH
jgi:hypothetical protein